MTRAPSSRGMTEHGSPGLPTLRGQGVAVGAETPRPPSETTAFEDGGEGVDAAGDGEDP